MYPGGKPEHDRANALYMSKHVCAGMCTKFKNFKDHLKLEIERTVCTVNVCQAVKT